ncbi:sorting nexin-14-like [Halichondria panicea]|uniref:sorting nexin-14-like n=1 Tax=Halichondria panicea TaxID=6063 RepID=UPI00312B70F1
MEYTVHTILAQVEGKAFWGAVALIFISFHLSNFLLYLLLLWCAGAGLLVAYTMLRVIPRLPNLLLHKPHPPRHSPKSSAHSEKRSQCPVCEDSSCTRHTRAAGREYLHPWDNISVPSSVDSALTELFELVLKRFVYSWHRGLAQSAEGFEDDLRLNIRFAVASLLRRAQRIDIPHIISHKLLQAVASHIYICNRVRRKLPLDASIAQIEAAVLQEYGSHLHTAMRGPTGNSRYFRQLTKTLIPLLLPEQVLHSRMMSSFIQELFTMKIFVPAMNFVAKPDFLNKLLLIVFNKNSRLEPMFGPETKSVMFLARFAKRRAFTRKPRPLSIPLKKLLEEQDKLYIFMNFMKSKSAIHVLQVYLTLDDLKLRVNNCTEGTACNVLSQVETLYRNYLHPSSHTYLPVDNVLTLTTVLEDSEATPMEKCVQLKEKGVFAYIRGHIYNELLVKIFYPQFCHDYKFYDIHISQRNAGASKSGRTGDKWRQKTSQVSMKVRLKPPSSPEPNSEQGRESPSVPEATPTSNLSIPVRIKVVDAVTTSHADGLRPYTIYYILASRKDGDSSKNYLVKRRFKEFICLDAKLRHFHGSIPPNLPSKRTFRNLDKAFVDTRIKELEQYLQELIETPGVREGQVLASFLDESSDPTLFMPDTVGDKAGKVINSVTNIFKNEKGPYVEELLQSLLQMIEHPQTPPSSDDMNVTGGTNRESSSRYVEQQCEDMSNQETKPWHKPPSLGTSVQIDSLMDLVVMLATNVYQVNPLQLTTLMLVKLLGQESIESVVYNFIAGRIDMMTNEQKLIQLIYLFRDNLFFNKDPPRTHEDICERLKTTFHYLATYPNPLVMHAVGEQRYRDGTARIIEGLQCRELNKQLFFKLLDIFILELFPELQQHD